METLKVGDVRKKGDQVRSLGVNSHSVALVEKQLNKEGKEINVIVFRNLPNKWRPTDLIGHEIFPSDLMHLEFRRP